MSDQKSELTRPEELQLTLRELQRFMDELNNFVVEIQDGGYNTKAALEEAETEQELNWSVAQCMSDSAALIRSEIDRGYAIKSNLRTTLI